MVVVHPLLHRVELLLLIVVEHRLDGVIASLHDGARLRAAVFWRGGLILEQGLHLLLALYQQRLDLRLLVWSQVEFAGEALELAVGIHTHAASVRCVAGRSRLSLILTWSLGWGSVLGDSGACGAEREHAAQGEA